MGELIFLGITLALLAAFIALVEWERTRGMRVFAHARDHFDGSVVRAHAAAARVDWAAYITEHLSAFGLWLSHEAAHQTLRLVRFMERSLSRTVRHLRMRAASDIAPAETTRPFVRALSDFKEELKTSRPDNIGEPPA